jgi:hypothetical protein
MKIFARSVAIVALAVFTVTSSSPVEATPLTYQAILSPEVTGATGSGTALAVIDATANTMRVVVNFAGLSGNVTVAHIHAPTTTAFTGTAGVATPTPTFPGFPSGGTSGSYDQTFDMTLTSSYRAGFITDSGGTTAGAEARLFSAIADGKAYLNVHSSTFPGGEIRGFFVLAPVPEIDPATGSSALSLVAGVLAMIEQRRRRAMLVA